MVNGQPRELGLADAIHVFIDHRADVVQRGFSEQVPQSAAEA